MARTAPREEISTIRMTEADTAAATLVASLTSRTRSALIQHALRLYIMKNYPAAYRPGAKVVLRLEEAPEEGGAA